MGLSTAYGIGSLKPGVCTSTSRPASPFNGQTIYETDTDLVKVWNGSSWDTVGPTTVPTSGLRLLIGKTTFTSVTSFSLPNDTFTSTYDNYRMILVVDSGGGAMSAKWRASGTDTSVSYYWGIHVAGMGGTGYNTGGNNVTSMGLSSSAESSYSAVIDIISPKPVTRSRLVWTASSHATLWGGTIGAGHKYANESHDSLTILSASSMTGWYVLYGYNQ